jgi:hypothetical protein
MTWSTVVTFESAGGGPVVIRREIVDSEPESVARRAVFTALSEAKKTKWESCVVVMERKA